MKKENRMTDKGETLIELIVSLALLALLVTMLVTVFKASTGSLYDTISTKRDLNAQAGRLLLEEQVEKAESLTIRYQYASGGSNHEGSFGAELLKVSGGSLYKFR